MDKEGQGIGAVAIGLLHGGDDQRTSRCSNYD